jgi:hypothetical protein
MFAAGWIALNHNISLAGIHSKIIYNQQRKLFSSW